MDGHGDMGLRGESGCMGEEGGVLDIAANEGGWIDGSDYSGC